MNQDQGKSGAQTRGVRYITPPNVLRQKIGYGGVDPSRMERAESFIRGNEFDFLPHAREFLAQMDRCIAQARKTPDKNALEMLTRPTMELKANGAMFGYRLISEIAEIILDFMESIHELNDDALEIIIVHQKTLNVIATSKLTGDGGREGRALAEELYGVCKRYYKKYNIPRPE